MQAEVLVQQQQTSTTIVKMRMVLIKYKVAPAIVTSQLGKKLAQLWMVTILEI